MLGSADSFQCLFWIEHIVILFVIDMDIIIMLDIVRPKINISDDSKIGINQYRNPYLTKLTIKILPQYSKIKGPTFIHPLQNYNNVAIVQSLPLWRNQNFRIGLLWQQNIKNSFNRSHIGFSAEYHIAKNYIIRSKNLVGNTFFTTTEVSKMVPYSNKLLTFSALHSSFFQSTSQYFHTIGAGVTLNNTLSININKRLGAETALKIGYEKLLKHDLYLRMKYDTQVERYDQSTLEVALGYYWSRNASFWLRTALETDKIEPHLSVELEVKNQNNHCLIGSVQLCNEKSILYLGYKCPSFNLIFPVFGTDSVVPALIGLAVYALGYIYRKKQEQDNKEKILHEKNRYDQIKLISDKANENYRKEQANHGLLVQEVFVGEKKLLEKFLAEPNKLVQLIRSEEYKYGVYDGTISFRFYVQRGQLNLPKGNKLALLGFHYYKPDEDSQIQIYVKYKKQSKIVEKFFKENDAINL